MSFTIPMIKTSFKLFACLSVKSFHRSKKMVSFLDVLIQKEQSIIWTDHYIKPTDTRRYLPFHLPILNPAK